MHVYVRVYEMRVYVRVYEMRLWNVFRQVTMYLRETGGYAMKWVTRQDHHLCELQILTTQSLHLARTDIAEVTSRMSKLP